MKIKPANRNLLIEIPTEEEKAESTFLLPENYKKKEIERYTVVRVKDISDDCEKTHHYHIGTRCVVETSMINEIKVDAQTYNIVPENYVVLFVEG